MKKYCTRCIRCIYNQIRNHKFLLAVYLQTTALLLIGVVQQNLNTAGIIFNLGYAFNACVYTCICMKIKNILFIL
jgi:hypothetical protein